jgi:hypothetical protein
LSALRCRRATIRNAVSQAMALFRRGLGEGDRAGDALLRAAVLPADVRDGGMCFGFGSPLDRRIS